MQRFFRELESLTRDLVEMSEKTVEMVQMSIEAILEKREDLVPVVFEREEEINRREVEIEEKAISLMARFQPEAENLRTLVTIIKINNDIERIADHAVNIAERAAFLIKEPQVKPYIDLPRMAEIAEGMLTDALKSFETKDPVLAKSICARDDIVDGLYIQIFRELLTYMLNDPRLTERSIRIIEVAKSLERIADLATNLCEDVIYMAEGKVIKHHFNDLGREREVE